MNQEKIELWKERIHEQKASGLTVPEWCKTRHVSKNAYYYWMKCINRTNKELEDPETIFAELPVCDSQKEIVQGIILRWNELEIPLSNQKEIPLVAELITQLHKKC